MLKKIVINGNLLLGGKCKMAQNKCRLGKKLPKYFRGFTLIEVMISVAILTVVVTSLLMSIVSCVMLNQASSNFIVAASDAQDILEDIKSLPNIYNDIDSYLPPGLNSLTNETVSVNVLQVSEGLKEVTVNVEWVDKQRQNSFLLTTRINR